MTVAAQINRVVQNSGPALRAKMFVHYARYLALGKGASGTALELAEANRALPEITRVFKAAISAGSTANMSALVEYQTLADAFVASLGQTSAFDRMLPDMIPVPFRMNIVAVTTGLTAFTVLENKPKPICTLELDNHQLTERKAVALLVFTQELLRLSRAELFETELRKAVVRQTDTEFVAVITTGLTPIASAGGTAVNIRADLSTAFASIETDEASKIFILMNSATAKNLSTLGDESGASFPGMTPSGGILCGATAIVTAGVGDDLVVVDAAGLGQRRHDGGHRLAARGPSHEPDTRRSYFRFHRHTQPFPTQRGSTEGRAHLRRGAGSRCGRDRHWIYHSSP